MDPKYYLAFGAALILGLIFIKKLWKIVIILALAGAVYWYFFLK